jgi:predicted Zn finger-like uncharacterized protein
MLIQCPKCSTGWRVADTAPADNPVFKCGRCHHLFRRFPGAPTRGEQRPERADRREASRRDDDARDNLEFIFPERTDAPAEAPAAAAAASAAPPAAAERAAAPPDDEADLPNEPLGVSAEEEDDEDTEFSFADADDAADEEEDDDPEDDGLDEEDDDETLAGDHRLGGWSPDIDEPAFARAPITESRVLHPEDTMAKAYGFTAIVRPLALIVALHAILALTIRIAPERAGEWLARIPIAGLLLDREPGPAESVHLRNVKGAFQHLRNARRVFVVSGEAVNQSPSSVERIEVQATLYGPGGQVDQKVVSTGNRTALTELSESEIALLQRLDPRKIVAPGESSAFLIVFLEPPREIREFSSRVLSVRPTRRASTTPERARLPAPLG